MDEEHIWMCRLPTRWDTQTTSLVPSLSWREVSGDLVVRHHWEDPKFGNIYKHTCMYMYIYIYICKTTLHCSVLTYTIEYGKLEYYYINIIIVHNTTVQYNTISTVHYTGRMQCSILWYLVTVHSSHITEDPITREWVFHGFRETFDDVTERLWRWRDSICFGTFPWYWCSQRFLYKISVRIIKW